MKILFVCLGNICRSPSAEAIFKKIVSDNNLSKEFYIDSAGTAAYHEGEPADYRMRLHAEKRGYQLTSISRPIISDDFNEFDMIVAMDDNNYYDLKAMSEKRHHHKIKLMTDYCSNYTNNGVPDPYYGGDKGFELVIDILEDASLGLLKDININLE